MAQAEKNPFSDRSLLEFFNKDQLADIKAAVDAMEKAAKKYRLTISFESNLKRTLGDFTNFFHTSSTSGTGARLPPLKAELVPDIRTIKIRQREY